MEELNGNLKILPLHTSLSKEDQERVYKKYDERKIILSTNIAETAITIDDVVYVIDSGRVKYRIRDGLMIKYKLDFISKSSYKQRMGRAGRVSNGVCYRMYCGDTYNSFREKNIPQIYLESLEETILSLKSLGIQNLKKFPFLTEPSEESLESSLKILKSLNVLDDQEQINFFGMKISKFPLNP